MLKAIEPESENLNLISTFIRAIHPLLQLALAKKQHSTINNDKPDVVIPLDIQLTIDKHLLIISGPNAGGKSVCLKTVGLLQYMLQCGISIPVSERSTAGTFQKLNDRHWR